MQNTSILIKNWTNIMDTIHEALYGFLHASQAYQSPTQKNTQYLDCIIQKRHVSLLNVGFFEYNFKASLLTVITNIVNFSVF